MNQTQVATLLSEPLTIGGARLTPANDIFARVRQQQVFKTFGGAE
jgi:hypothetical protein